MRPGAEVSGYAYPYDNARSRSHRSTRRDAVKLAATATRHDGRGRARLRSSAGTRRCGPMHFTSCQAAIAEAYGCAAAFSRGLRMVRARAPGVGRVSPPRRIPYPDGCQALAVLQARSMSLVLVGAGRVRLRSSPIRESPGVSFPTTCNVLTLSARVGTRISQAAHDCAPQRNSAFGPGTAPCYSSALP